MTKRILAILGGVVFTAALVIGWSIKPEYALAFCIGWFVLAFGALLILQRTRFDYIEVDYSGTGSGIGIQTFYCKRCDKYENFPHTQCIPSEWWESYSYVMRDRAALEDGK